MIKSFTITNHIGDTLILDLFDPYKSGFIVMEVDGLGPAEASINTTDYSTIDGSYYNSARIRKREIDMKLRLLEHPTIEDTRHIAYRYFPVKKKIKMGVETDRRSIAIEGYVRKVDPNIFSENEEIEIVIECPDPFFYTANSLEVNFNGAVPLFEFPFENEGMLPEIVFGEVIEGSARVIEYEGDHDVGIEARMFFNQAATGVRLYHVEKNEAFKLDETRIPGGISAGDEIIVSTKARSKGVMLLRGGHYINILNSVTYDSSWFELQIGMNTIDYSAETGKDTMDVRINYEPAFGGI